MRALRVLTLTTTAVLLEAAPASASVKQADETIPASDPAAGSRPQPDDTTLK